MCLAHLTFYSLVLVVLHVDFSMTIEVSSCKKTWGPLPTNVSVEGCNYPPCTLRHKEDAVLHLTFIVDRYTTRMTTVIKAYDYLHSLLNFITVPFLVDLEEKSRTCNYLRHSECPLLPGSIVDYTLRFHIPTKAPTGISPKLEISIVDQDRYAVTCLRIPVRITK